MCTNNSHQNIFFSVFIIGIIIIHDSHSYSNAFTTGTSNSVGTPMPTGKMTCRELMKRDTRKTLIKKKQNTPLFHEKRWPFSSAWSYQSSHPLLASSSSGGNNNDNHNDDSDDNNSPRKIDEEKYTSDQNMESTKFSSSSSSSRNEIIDPIMILPISTISAITLLTLFVIYTKLTNPVTDFDIDFYMALDGVRESCSIGGREDIDTIVGLQKLSPAEQLVGALFGPK